MKVYVVTKIDYNEIKARKGTIQYDNAWQDIKQVMKVFASYEKTAEYMDMMDAHCACGVEYEYDIFEVE